MNHTAGILEQSGYKLYGKDRQGKKGGRGERVAFCVKKWVDCKEFPLRNRQEQAESL